MVAPHITDGYSVIIVKFLFVYLPLRDLIRIESIKTTSMEDVSTRVLEKIKNI